MTDTPSSQELNLLKHIHSLGMVSESDIGPSMIQQLLRRKWVYQVWIGTYALTQAGKNARKGTL